MCNQEIREKIRGNGLFLWQVAEAYGINDGNFSRKLRKELPEEEKKKILTIIETLVAEQKEAAQ